MQQLDIYFVVLRMMDGLRYPGQPKHEGMCLLGRSRVLYSRSPACFVVGARFYTLTRRLRLESANYVCIQFFFFNVYMCQSWKLFVRFKGDKRGSEFWDILGCERKRMKIKMKPGIGWPAGWLDML